MIRDIINIRVYLPTYFNFCLLLCAEMKWTKLYQVPCLYVGKGKEKHRELVLRPAYPPIYSEKQIPSVISEVIVIRNDSWKVGDLVDWWTTGCYWSGRIRQLLGDDKAEVI